ncbi:MAG: Nif11-like leader peptide family natural product precursor [Alphaproteobacteria bacterium]|nr:Nif11-like leader peptide family natural product precursor [Alphaproteobacteria bacterium]
MTPSLSNFFKAVSSSNALQKRLYGTKEILDVVDIAHELGFKITAGEVLKAQAGRLIELSKSHPEEIMIAVAGKKPNLGAQWGREGSGYLDRAGYWFIHLNDWDCGIEHGPEITRLLFHLNENHALQSEISACKTMDEIAQTSVNYGFNVSASAVLIYQAQCILSLDNERAELVARGADAEIKDLQRSY